MAGKIKEFFNMFAMNDEDYEEYDDELIEDDYDDEEDEEDDDDSGFSLSGLFGGSKKKGYDDDDDEFDDDYDDFDDSYSSRKKKQAKPKAMEAAPTLKPAPKQSSSFGGGSNNKLVSINNRKKNNNRGSQVYVIKPQDFNDAQTVTDYLREGRAIVINLEGIDLLVAQRVIDFIGGSCYALDGSLQAISANIFIAAPNAVDVSGDLRSEILGEDAYSPDLTRY